MCLLSSFAMGQQDIWYWRDGEFYKGKSVDSITFTKPGATDIPPLTWD